MRWQEIPSAERTQLVADTWVPAYSARHLATAISEKLDAPITRNAIIGIYDRNPEMKKTHPLGGPRFHDGETLRPATAGPGFRKPKKPKDPVVSLMIPKSRPIRRKPEHVAFDQASFNVPLDELGKHDCHWPVNDPAVGEKHLFCGLNTEEGDNYCPEHRQRSIR